MTGDSELRLAIREAIAQGNAGRVGSYAQICKAEGQKEAAKLLVQIAKALQTNLWNTERALWVFDHRLPWQQGYFDE